MESSSSSPLDFTKVELHKGLYADHVGFHELREKLESEGYTVFVWQDSPGTQYQNTSHPNDELVVVATGGIVFTIFEQEFALDAGDALTLPANTMHNAQNVGHLPCCYFICTRAVPGQNLPKPPV